ncbi:MAG UNVERIFIED_CONTAM: hypothetical protein LVT10_27270 [Anaerolineae bacterium]
MWRFPPTGRFALSGSDDNTLTLVGRCHRRPVRTFTGHTWSVTSVAFSPMDASP